MRACSSAVCSSARREILFVNLKFLFLLPAVAEYYASLDDVHKAVMVAVPLLNPNLLSGDSVLVNYAGDVREVDLFRCTCSAKLRYLPVCEWRCLLPLATRH